MKHPASKQRKIEIEIDDSTKKIVTVYEIKVKQIKKIFSGEIKTDNAFYEQLLPLCSDVTIADLEEFYPSDIKRIWDTFKEVNAAFLGLDVIRQAGELLIRKQTSQILKNLFVNLSEQDTGKSGNTDTVFSEPQAKN